MLITRGCQRAEVEEDDGEWVEVDTGRNREEIILVNEIVNCVVQL